MKRIVRYWLPALAGCLGLATPAVAVIQVNTVVAESDLGQGKSVRAQAVITEASGLGAGVQAIAIKEIRSAIFIIDGAVARGGNALAVNKRQLTAAEAYGEDLPFGYNFPPTTDPTGPWQGLMWPYRDQYDYFPDVGDPLGDDVGTAFSISPNVYGFVDVDGIARGGPTDPSPAGGDVNLLLRGITGNGLNGPASYFAFDIESISGPSDRFITIQVISTTARVVIQDSDGKYDELVVNVPNFETVIQLPEPALAGLAPLVVFLLRRRCR